MNGPMISPTGAAKTLADLWDRAPAFLWALAVSSFFVTVIAAGAELISRTFPGLAFWIAFGAFAVFLTFATARTLEDKHRASLFIVPKEALSFVAVTRQTDGSIITQIAVHLDIYNRTRGPVLVAHAELVRPKTSTEVLESRILARAARDGRPSPLLVDSGDAFSAHFLVRDDLGEKIKRNGLVIAVYGGRGRRNEVRVRRIRVT